MQAQRQLKDLGLKISSILQTRFTRFLLSGGALTLTIAVAMLVLHMAGQGHVTAVLFSHTHAGQQLVSGSPAGDPGFH